MTRVVLSLGSNINRQSNLKFAIDQIKNYFGDIERSPIYETTSVGFEGPSFYNLACAMVSNRELLEVREMLRGIESAAGRVRGRKSFNNRVLDIDVILFGDEDRGPEFNIPRDEIEKYAYVLKPLSDLIPDGLHPITQQPFSAIWEAFDPGDQMLKVVNDHFLDAV